MGFPSIHKGLGYTTHSDPREPSSSRVRDRRATRILPSLHIGGACRITSPAPCWRRCRSFNPGAAFQPRSLSATRGHRDRSLSLMTAVFVGFSIVRHSSGRERQLVVCQLEPCSRTISAAKKRSGWSVPYCSGIERLPSAGLQDTSRSHVHVWPSTADTARSPRTCAPAGTDRSRKKRFLAIRSTLLSTRTAASRL